MFPRVRPASKRAVPVPARVVAGPDPASAPGATRRPPATTSAGSAPLFARDGQSHRPLDAATTKEGPVGLPPAFTDAQRDQIQMKRLVIGRRLRVDARPTREGLVAVLSWKQDGAEYTQEIAASGHRRPATVVRENRG